MTTEARKTELRNAIVAYIRKHDRCPNFATIGTDWHECQPIFEEMHKDGTLVWDIRISPKGRRMTVIRLGPNA
jgi:hypothetical protein